MSLSAGKSVQYTWFAIRVGPGIVEGHVAEPRVDVEVGDAAVLLELGSELGLADLDRNVADEQLAAGHVGSDHSLLLLLGDLTVI